MKHEAKPVLILAAVVLAIGTFVPANATSEFVGVELSQTCLIQVANNLPTNCPTYQQLMPLDQSIYGASGLFTSTPYYHRESNGVANEAYYYENMTMPYAVIVDPSGNLLANAGNTITDQGIAGAAPDVKQLIIEPQGFTYIPPIETGTTVADNGKPLQLPDFVGQYVDPTCSYAMIAYTPALLESAIQYLGSNCSTGNFNQTSTMTIPMNGTSTMQTNNEGGQVAYNTQIQQVAGMDCVDQKCIVVNNPDDNPGFNNG
jgi:hypothetical protein